MLILTRTAQLLINDSRVQWVMANRTYKDRCNAAVNIESGSEPGSVEDQEDLNNYTIRIFFEEAAMHVDVVGGIMGGALFFFGACRRGIFRPLTVSFSHCMTK